VCSQEDIDAATRLYIAVCAVFQIKCRNINACALVGLSKILGGDLSRTLKKPWL